MLQITKESLGWVSFWLARQGKVCWRWFPVALRLQDKHLGIATTGRGNSKNLLIPRYTQEILRFSLYIEDSLLRTVQDLQYHGAGLG